MAGVPTYRAELNYQNEITADEITVIFNGTTYTVPKENGTYGWAELMRNSSPIGDYPFCIARESDTNYVYVNLDVYHDHNPFTIKIVEDRVTTTECFEKAVQSIASPLVVQASLVPSQGTSSTPSLLDASAEDIRDAMKTRGVIVEDPQGDLYSVLYVSSGNVTIGTSYYNSTEGQSVFEAYDYTDNNGTLQYPPRPAH